MLGCVEEQTTLKKAPHAKCERASSLSVNTVAGNLCQKYIEHVATSREVRALRTELRVTSLLHVTSSCLYTIM